MYKIANINIPNINISKNTLHIILYVITLALAVGYLMDNQVLAFVSLFVIAGLIYYVNENIIYALSISIIITNLLLTMQYLEPPKIDMLAMK
jgi:hypothetical protein